MTPAVIDDRAAYDAALVEGRRIFAAARIRVQQREPYFTTAVMGLCVVEVPGFGTMGVDENFTLYFDPLAAATWGIDYVTTVTGHEIRHPLFEHMSREAQFTETWGGEFKRWWKAILAVLKATGMKALPHDLHGLFNILQDAEINSSMRNTGQYKMPSDAILPEKLGLRPGPLWEVYAMTILERAKKAQPEPDGGEGEEGEGEPNAGGAADPRGRRGHEQQRKGDKGKDQEGASGRSGQGGAGDASPADGDDANSGDEVVPGSGKARTGSNRPGCGGGCIAHPRAQAQAKDRPSDAEAAGIRRAVAAAVQASASKGNVAADLVAWADEKLKPPAVPWERELAARVRGVIADAAGAMDYTYRRVSRRQHAVRHAGIILPAIRQPIPSVVVVEDVSGSMGSGAGSPAEKARSEIAGVLKALRTPCTVLSTDVRVAATTKVYNTEDVRHLPRTSGGTDMTVGIAEADKLKPDVIIVLTDGYTDWPTAASMPKARLVACVVKDTAVPDHIYCVRIPKK